MSVQLKSEIKRVGYQVLREALLPVGLSFLVPGFNRTDAEIAQLTLYSRMRKKIEKKFATYVDQSGERADGFFRHIKTGPLQDGVVPVVSGIRECSCYRVQMCLVRERESSGL